MQPFILPRWCLGVMQSWNTLQLRRYLQPAGMYDVYGKNIYKKSICKSIKIVKVNKKRWLLKQILLIVLCKNAEV